MENSNVFVGRDAELKTLKAALEAATGESLQVCLVAGDPGDGKTTLVENFLAQSKEEDPRLWYAIGTCDKDTGQNDYYEPFRDIFSQLAGVRTKNLESLVTSEQEFDPQNLARATIEILREFAPELIGTLIPGASLISKVALAAADKVIQRRIQVSTDKEARVRHNEIRKQSIAFFEQRARRGPLVLVVDDLQWVDRLSLDLLVHIVRHLRNAAVLMILTYRPSDLTQGSESGGIKTARDLIDLAEQECSSVEIDLRKTRSSHGDDFVKKFLDANGCVVSTDFADAFFARTGAWPIVAVELLRFLKDHRVLEQNQLGLWKEMMEVSTWSDLPVRLTKPEALIAARIEQLSEELQEVLKVASVEGFEFTAQVIVSIIGMDERTLLRTLSDDLGRKHGFVVEINEERVGDRVLSHYRFTNIRYQDSIYRSMGTPEKRVLHGRVAEALESFYEKGAAQIAIHLAEHYERGAKLGKAAQYLIETGNQQAAKGEYEVAIRTFDRGLSLAREAGFAAGIVDALRFSAVNARIRRGSKEDWIEAEDLLNECVTASGKGNLLEALSFALRAQGRVHRHHGRHTQAISCYVEGLNIAKQLNNQREEAKFYSNIGVLAEAEGRLDDAWFYYQKRHDLARNLDDDEGLVVASMNLASCLRKKAESEGEERTKNLREAHERLQEAETLNESLADSDRAIGIQVLKARVYTAGSDFLAAAKLLCEALATAIKGDFEARVKEGLVGFVYLMEPSASDEPLLAEVIGVMSMQGNEEQKNEVNRAKLRIQNALPEREFSSDFQEAEQQGRTMKPKDVSVRVIEFLRRFS